MKFTLPALLVSLMLVACKGENLVDISTFGKNSNVPDIAEVTNTVEKEATPSLASPVSTTPVTTPVIVTPGPKTLPTSVAAVDAVADVAAADESIADDIKKDICASDELIISHQDDFLKSAKNCKANGFCEQFKTELIALEACSSKIAMLAIAQAMDILSAE